MPVVLSSLCFCDKGAVFSVSCLVIMQVLLFFYFSWQFCEWLQSHPWMTSMAAVSPIPQPLLMASHVVHTLMEYLSAHHLVLPILSPLHSCSLVYPYILYCIDRYAHTWYFFISVLWLYLDTQPAINSFGLGLYTILYCIDAFIMIFLAASVIRLLHLS